MRILLVHNKYQHEGGEDVAVALQLQLLREKGHEAEVLYFSNQSLSGPLSKLAGAGRAFYNKQSARQLKAMIESFSPDIVHVHNVFFEASPSIFYVCNKMRIPVVLTIHNYRLICANALMLRDNKPCELCTQQVFPLSGIRYRCYRNSALESGLVTSITGTHKVTGTWKNRIDRYILLTDFALKKIAGSSLSIPTSKLRVIPNYTLDRGIGPDVREGFYLYVGRLSKEKGVETLLHAFSKLNCTLLLAGTGPEKERLESEFGTLPNIEFAGERTKTEVIDLMKRSRALVFPSLWYEGLPFTIIEAFSTGTPVISSRLGAMEDLIKPGYNGYHFTAGDVVALQQTIMLFEREAGQYLYENARKSYVEGFTPKVHYENLVRLYEELK